MSLNFVIKGWINCVVSHPYLPNYTGGIHFSCPSVPYLGNRSGTYTIPPTSITQGPLREASQM